MTSSPKNKSTKRALVSRIGIITVICLPIVAVLFILKVQTTATPLLSNNNKGMKENTPTTIAKPDTSTSIEHLSMIVAQPTDTTNHTLTAFETSVDPRTPAEAGAEDGYWDGYYDGTARDTTRERYNENSNYSLPNNIQIYKEHYNEGYEAGFSEALKKEP